MPFATLLKKTITAPAISGLLLAGLVLLTAAAPVAAQFFGPPTSYSSGSASAPRGMLLADVTGDGRADIITANYGSSQVGVQRALAGGGFGPVVHYPTGANPLSVALGDVNGDGRPDLVTANYQPGSVSVLPALAAGGFGSPLTLSTGAASQPATVLLGDVTGDGRLDIMVGLGGQLSFGGLPGVGMFAALAGGGFAPMITQSTNSFLNTAIALLLTDVTADGRPDVVFTSHNSDSVGVLPGLAGGGLGRPRLYAVGAGRGPRRTAVDDVTGDGRPDLVVATIGGQALVVLAALPGGGFGPPTAYATGNGLFDVKLADVTGDGRLDAIVAQFATGNNPGIGVLPGQAGGRFGPMVLFSTGTAYTFDVVVGDVNGDTRPDLLVTTFSTDDVRVFLNLRPGLATAAATATAPLLVYPNPATGHTTVQLPAGATHLTLLNALGQTIQTHPLAEANTPREFELSLAGLPAGVYAVRVQAGAAGAVRRLVVE